MLLSCCSLLKPTGIFWFKSDKLPQIGSNKIKLDQTGSNWIKSDKLDQIDFLVLSDLGGGRGILCPVIFDYLET